VKAAEGEVSRAIINLNLATITAPISGVIISRNVDVGQTVAASFTTPTLFTIANDLKKMQLLANVDEADIGLIKIHPLREIRSSHFIMYVRGVLYVIK
jgi:HlyD family secretion protein